MFISIKNDDHRIKVINFFISLIPLSIILGNLAININVIIIAFLGILIFKEKIFLIKNKFDQYLIYSFFYI